MSPTILSPGIEILTDNWLLQNAAGLLAGTEDPSDDAHWVSYSQQHGLSYIPTKAGAVQLECLASLLEQLVLNECLYVMPGWTEAWTSRIPALDELRTKEIIKEVPEQAIIARERQDEYLDYWCTDDHIRQVHHASMKAFAKGDPMFVGQVINGTAAYLALSEQTSLPYAPHPIRALFLDETLYDKKWKSSAHDKFRELVDDSRVKLTQLIRPDSTVTRLTYILSSVAILCLRESSQSVSPLQAALQLREESEVKQLRGTLHEYAVALAQDDVKRAIDCVGMLDAAILETERRLKTRKLSDDTDGPREINVFSIPLQIPKILHTPIRSPRHTSIVCKLVKTGVSNISDLLAKSVGIRDPAVVEALLQAPAKTRTKGK